MSVKRCNPAGKIIAPLILLVIIREISERPILPETSLLSGALHEALLLLVAMLISTSLGIYTKSPLMGLLAILYLRPEGLEGMLQYQWYAVTIFTIAVLLVTSYLRGPWDSVLEVFTRGERYYITPILASITFGLILAKVKGHVPDINYWVYVIGNGLLLSRLAVNPLIAFVGGAIAATGSLGAIAIGLYASYTPLPAIECEGLVVGKLVGYEADTSITRSLLSISSKRWRSRIMACSYGTNARVKTGERSVLWVYNSNPLPVAKHIARLNKTANKRIIQLELDPPGEIEDPAKIFETLEGPRDALLKLGSLDETMIEAILSALPDVLKGGEIVVVNSCRYRPRELQRYISRIAKKAMVIAAFCTVEPDQLMPASGSEGASIVLGSLGDPLLAASILSKLFPEYWKSLDQLLKHYSNLSLVYPYCNGGWALVELVFNTPNKRRNNIMGAV